MVLVKARALPRVQVLEHHSNRPLANILLVVIKQVVPQVVVIHQAVIIVLLAHRTIQVLQIIQAPQAPLVPVVLIHLLLNKIPLLILNYLP